MANVKPSAFGTAITPVSTTILTGETAGGVAGRFTVSQLPGGASDSESVTYLPPFTSSTSRTVEDKLAEQDVHLWDFATSSDRASIIAGSSPDMATALIAMRNAIKADQGTSDKHYRILMPPYQIKYTNGRWLGEINSFTLEGNGCQLQNSANKSYFVDMHTLFYSHMFMNHGDTDYPGDGVAMTSGHILNAVVQGSITVTTTTPGDAANYLLGDYVLVFGFDQQFGGLPPNMRYFYYGKVTVAGVAGTGVVTLDRGAPFPMSTSWLDTTNYAGTGLTYGKPRIVRLRRTGAMWPTVARFNNVRFNASVNVVAGFSVAGRRVEFNECIFDYSYWPGSVEDLVFNYCRSPFAWEFDKLIERVTMNNCHFAGPDSGTGTNIFVATDCTFDKANMIRFSARKQHYIRTHFSGQTGIDFLMGPYPQPHPIHERIFKDCTASAAGTDVSFKELFMADEQSLTVTATNANGEILLTDNSTNHDVISRLDIGFMIMKSDFTKYGIVTSITHNGTQFVLQGTWATPVAAEVWWWSPVQKEVFENFRRNTVRQLAPSGALFVRKSGVITLTQDDILWNNSGNPNWGGRGYHKIVRVRHEQIVPYSGANGTATIRIGAQNAAGSGDDWIAQINMLATGVRDITTTMAMGAQSGDTLTPANAGGFRRTIQIYLDNGIGGAPTIALPKERGVFRLDIECASLVTDGLSTEGSSLGGVPSRITIPGITADKGDAGATYTLSHPSSEVQHAGTTFTANRTVTLPTLSAADGGVTYTFLRDAATPGSFTWTIGSAGVIPSAAKARLTVMWDANTTSWRQIGYGVLV